MNIMLLIMALINVESAGNDLAVGDGGLAYGCLQIHAGYVKDVNRAYGTTFTHEDMFNREDAIEVTKLYAYLYTNKRRLGHEPSYEDFARNHNGGLYGYKRKSTLKYWAKVKKELERLKDA